MNEYWDVLNGSNGSSSSASDYRFVYAGPAGSWTPLHRDVFGSFSWSANVAGVKRWTLYAPGQERFLEDAEDGSLAYDVREISGNRLFIVCVSIDSFSQINRFPKNQILKRQEA